MLRKVTRTIDKTKLINLVAATRGAVLNGCRPQSPKVTTSTISSRLIVTLRILFLANKGIFSTELNDFSSFEKF